MTSSGVVRIGHKRYMRIKCRYCERTFSHRVKEKTRKYCSHECHMAYCRKLAQAKDRRLIARMAKVLPEIKELQPFNRKNIDPSVEISRRNMV
jgi:hypothetical protein